LSFASINLSGTVKSAPELRFTPESNVAVANFQLSFVSSVRAVTVGGTPNLLSVKVNCWRQLAEAASSQLAKGQNVLVEGRPALNNFTGADGVQKKVFEIDASQVYLISNEGLIPLLSMATGGAPSAKASSGSASPQAMPGAPVAASVASATKPYASDSLLSDITEDDIPF
jgi:single-strand DNA-binding protein